MEPTVLIVEDEAFLAGLLSDVLGEAGYNVVLTTGSRAVDRVLDQAPAVIVIDYLLPGVNGGEVVQRVRAAVPATPPPVILVTGLSNARELAREVGANAYLRKPFDVDKLVTLVGRFAKRAEA